MYKSPPSMRRKWDLHDQSDALKRCVGLFNYSQLNGMINCVRVAHSSKLCFLTDKGIHSQYLLTHFYTYKITKVKTSN